MFSCKVVVSKRPDERLHDGVCKVTCSNVNKYQFPRTTFCPSLIPCFLQKPAWTSRQYLTGSIDGYIEPESG